jgi:hypothetical protein
MRASLEVRLLSKLEPDIETGCWNWTASRFPAGYGQISGMVDGVRRNLYVHRVSYEIHCGPIPDGMLVCHKCDNRICGNPDHFFLGTYADNNADRSNKGRNATGEKISGKRRSVHGLANGRVKLTEADVLAIRAAAGGPRLKLAKKYGVGPTQISRIWSRESWPLLSDHRVSEIQTEGAENERATSRP